jgi:hypothetical protein
MLRVMRQDAILLLFRVLPRRLDRSTIVLLASLFTIAPALTGCAILGVGAAVVAADAATSSGQSEKAPTSKVRPPEAAR